MNVLPLDLRCNLSYSQLFETSLTPAKKFFPQLSRRLHFHFANSGAPTVFTLLRCHSEYTCPKLPLSNYDPHVFVTLRFP